MLFCTFLSFLVCECKVLPLKELRHHQPLWCVMVSPILTMRLGGVLTIYMAMCYSYAPRFSRIVNHTHNTKNGIEVINGI